MDTISNCKTLAEITARRLSRYNDRIADGDNLEGVLIGIYEKPTHFVYELLQNADDARATCVCFELTNDKLIFSHNGDKDFNLKDIISITGIGNSTKKTDDSVGKFGVGFKSVFAVTNTPYIYNRAFNFRIENLSIPYEIPGTNLGEYTTKFELNLGTDKFSPDELIPMISDGLKDLDCATIMFLRNINTLKIIDRGAESQIILTREKLEKYESVKDVSAGKQFLLFNDRDNATSIAFNIEAQKINPLSDLFAYSFLPTRVKSELPFYINAPFELATTRESINFSLSYNKKILSNLSKLYHESLLTLRDIELIDQNFLNNVITVDKNLCTRSEIYDSLYKETITILSKEPILPNIDGEYITSTEGVFYTHHEMVGLARDMANWLNINTGQSKIRTFLKHELGVNELSFVDFVKNIADKYIKTKNNEWLTDFYCFCSENINYWNSDEFKNIPFIKTRSGNFKSAYVGNEEQLFRPPSNGLSNYKIINSIFTAKSNSDKVRESFNSLLSALGIKQRTPRQTIEMSLLSNWDNLDDKERHSVFLKICEIYNDSSEANKKDIVNLLLDKEIFLAEDRNGSYWEKASNIMRGTPEQKLVFKDSLFLKNDIWTEIIELDEKNNERERGTCNLCRDLGIVSFLPIKKQVHWEPYFETLITKDIINEYKIPTDIYPRWWLKEKYDIANFKECIESFTNKKQSQALIELLKHVSDGQLMDRAAGTYEGRAYKEYSSQKIPASFLRTLKKIAWIYTDESVNPKKPYEFSKSEFTRCFKLDGNEPFLDLIGLRPDAIDELPEREKIGAKFFADLSDEEMNLAMNTIYEHRKRKSSDKQDAEEIKSDDVNESEILESYPSLGESIVNSEEKDDFLIMSDDSIIGNDISGIALHEYKESNAVVTSIKSVETPINPQFTKAIGDLGEKRINDYLISRYGNENVKWFGGDNKGYDFTITENGVDIAYIESKTTTNISGKILITPSEWNMARTKLEKYYIYILNAKNGNLKIIKNPFQKYIDKKINIEVKALFIPDLDEK